MDNLFFKCCHLTKYLLICLSLKERWDGQPSALCFRFSLNACGGWGGKNSQPLSVQISKESGDDFISPWRKGAIVNGEKKLVILKVQSYKSHPLPGSLYRPSFTRISGFAIQTLGFTFFQRLSKLRYQETIYAEHLLCSAMLMFCTVLSTSEVASPSWQQPS